MAGFSPFTFTLVPGIELSLQACVKSTFNCQAISLCPTWSHDLRAPENVIPPRFTFCFIFFYLLKENITFLIRTLNGNHFYTSTLLHFGMFPICHVIWKPAVASHCDFVAFLFDVECLLIDSLAPLFGSMSHLQNGLLRYLVLSVRRAASLGRVVLCHMSCLSCISWMAGCLSASSFPFWEEAFGSDMVPLIISATVHCKKLSKL